MTGRRTFGGLAGAEPRNPSGYAIMQPPSECLSRVTILVGWSVARSLRCLSEALPRFCACETPERSEGVEQETKEPWFFSPSSGTGDAGPRFLLDPLTVSCSRTLHETRGAAAPRAPCRLAWTKNALWILRAFFGAGHTARGPPLPVHSARREAGLEEIDREGKSEHRQRTIIPRIAACRVKRLTALLRFAPALRVTPRPSGA